MKERPIVMTAESVRAILDGRKTQTRRVVRPQPEFVWGYGIKLDDQDHFSAHVRYPGARVEQPDPWIRCPYGVPGDRLWVRETWQAINLDGQWWHEVKKDRELHNWAWTNPIEPAYAQTPPRWMSPIFMPRSASRLTLEILNIRVERVQEISEDNAVAEGIEPMFDGGVLFGYRDYSVENALFTLGGGRSYEMRSAERLSYRSLWDTLNAKRGYPWSDNPWVWVISFRVLP